MVPHRRFRFNQVPGGMISNLANQLKEQGALNRMSEVLAEIPRVREDLGYPPLVTPTSPRSIPAMHATWPPKANRSPWTRSCSKA